MLDVHYSPSAAGGFRAATGPRAACVAGSPSTLPLSPLAPPCHRVTHYVTGSQIPIFSSMRLSPLTLVAAAYARLSQDCHNAVQTIRQGRGSWGRACGRSRGMPAANAAPGKQYRTSHRRLRYYVRHRMVLAYDVVYKSGKNLYQKPTIS